MKSTGIVRKVDELGRVVIPMELRKTLNIDLKDSMEIFTNGEQIIFKKYQPSCVFCDNVDDTVVFNGKSVCSECLSKLKNVAKK